MFKVGAVTAGPDRQIALTYLGRAAFQAVRTNPSRGRYLAEALIAALPADAGLARD